MLVSLVVLAVLMVFHGIPDSNRENVSMIIGALAGYLSKSALGHQETRDVKVTNDASEPVPVDTDTENR